MKLAARTTRIAPSPTLNMAVTVKRLTSQGVHVIDFSAGEPAFDTPDCIREAAMQAIRDGFTHYTPVTGIDELKDAIIRPGGNLEEAAATRAEAGRRIYDYFDRSLDQRGRGQPGEDILWSLLEARIDGVSITREEQLDICFLFLLGGLDTVTATLGCSLLYLAENEEPRRRLREDPQLIPGAVEELLRWETPVMIVPRLVKQEVEVGGVRLEAGQIAMLLLGSANVDAGEFPDPTQVDFERERNRHLAFGGGPHRCLGSHLARFELRVALEELHRTLPDYHLDRSEPPQVSFGIREVSPLHLVFGAGL